MRGPIGQVAREAHRAVHYLLAGVMVLLLGCTVLGWRLAQGPIPIPAIAHAIESTVNTPDSPTRLSIGRASIAWEGLRGGGMTPLELRLEDARLLGEDGALRAELPDAEVSLSIPWLLRGRIAPRRLVMHGPVLRLHRDEEGRISAQLAKPGVEAEAAAAAATPLSDLLAELMAPTQDDTPFGALAQLTITDAQVMVEDATLGAWSLDNARIDLRRMAAGGIRGRAEGTLRLGEGRVAVTATLEAFGQPALATISLVLPDIRPAALAGLAAPLAPLAALDAPARVELVARLDGDGVLRGADAALNAGRGSLDLGGSRRIPIAALDGRAELLPDGVRIPHAAVRLDGPGAPLVTTQGEMRRGDGRWRATGHLQLDAAPLAELGRWWPEGLGTGERAWILENITAGTARNGNWQVGAEAAEDFSGLQIGSLSGALEVADATVHWLRPMAPAEQVNAQIGFALDEIRIQIPSARQSASQLQIRDGSLRVMFPAGAPPGLEAQLGIAGPVPDVVALVQHPRLRLFERRPLPLKDPQGVVDGRLQIGLPLLEDLLAEQVRVRATAQLRQVRLGDVLMGRALERGQFDLTVDNEGLRANGTATLAEIQARLGVEMDFRPGNANQVVMRETVQARADARQLAALGLAHEDVVRGPVALDVRTERRRGGQGRATVRADLRDATLTLEPVGWRKPAGQNAGADLVLRLASDSLDAIETFRIEAPSLLLRGNVAFARGTRLDRIAIAEGRIEDTRFTGEARPPAAADGPWRVTARGTQLDLRRRLAEDTPSGPAPANAPPGPALSLEGSFDRLLLGPGRDLAAIEARIAIDSQGVLREGRLTGRAGAHGPFDLAITPQGGGRALRLTAEDAGALLRSFDVLRHLEGGRLTVAGTFAHNGRGAPLAGSAEMQDFSVRNAPGFAKLLQAMTLFGLVEAMSGPGLGFSRLVAPFTLTPDSLALDNARAFSASLGLTARGTMDRRRQRMAMEGTIVPAYIFNSLLGNIPVLGRIFSPEAGGGLFAATFRLNGPIDDPQVSVNPLAALTPGFLRGLFGTSQALPAPTE